MDPQRKNKTRGSLLRIGMYFFLHKGKKQLFSKFTALPYSPDRRECEPCPNLEKEIVNTNGECEPCPEGSFPNGEKNACSKCKPDEIIAYKDSCKRCPHGFVPNKNRRFCIRCPSSLIAKSGICVSCPNPDKE